MAVRFTRQALIRSLLLVVSALALAGAAPAIAHTGDAAGADTPPTAAATDGASGPVGKGQAEPRIVLLPVDSDAFSLTVRPYQGHARTTTLDCTPPGGSHPSPERACGQLRDARGEIARIPPLDALCTMERAPVTVAAVGFWQGRSLAYQREFSNVCEAVRATGGVLFNF